MQFWLGILLTGLMGVSLGLLGGGGSILAVPILVYVYGEGAHEAIAMSLMLVGSTALAASVMHHRDGRVDWKAGALLAACAAPVSLLGAKAAMKLPGGLLLLLFGALMLVAGTAMFRRRESENNGPHKRHLLILLACGLVVGFLTGFLGVGGGFLIVPALVLFLGKPMKDAIGTSLFVIALNCATALWGHREALAMHWSVVLPATGAALVGMFAGVQMTKRFQAAELRKAFAVFVAVLGVAMIVKNAGAVLAK